jgi:D-sedoheptulose 7-phosphate isomerase
MNELVLKALQASQKALNDLLESPATIEQISEAGKALARCFQDGGRVYSCGNGGSMCDAMHFAEELSGRFREDRRPLAATAISDPSHISCCANDFGYHEVFSRYIAAHGRKGDMLLAISTSGSSKNIVRAAEMAKSCGVKVIALTGRENSELARFADFEICTPGGSPYADRVQELHIKCIHILIELVEFHLQAEEGRR